MRMVKKKDFVAKNVDTKTTPVMDTLKPVPTAVTTPGAPQLANRSYSAAYPGVLCQQAGL